MRSLTTSRLLPIWSVVPFLRISPHFKTVEYLTCHHTKSKFWFAAYQELSLANLTRLTYLEMPTTNLIKVLASLRHLSRLWVVAADIIRKNQKKRNSLFSRVISDCHLWTRRLVPLTSPNWSQLCIKLLVNCASAFTGSSLGKIDRSTSQEVT